MYQSNIGNIRRWSIGRISVNGDLTNNTYWSKPWYSLNGQVRKQVRKLEQFQHVINGRKRNCGVLIVIVLDVSRSMLKILLVSLLFVTFDSNVKLGKQHTTTHTIKNSFIINVSHKYFELQCIFNPFMKYILF